MHALFASLIQPKPTSTPLAEYSHTSPSGDGSSIAHKQPLSWKFILLIIGIVLAIGLTRAITLQHEIALHPDERHFFQSAQSLAQKIISPSSTYTVSKIYPEGAFVLQSPFQLVDILFCKWTGATPQPKLWGRIASLVYYIGGVLLGILLLCRYWKASMGCVAVYGFLMCFSLLQMEQSRYATGESPSFFIMMALLCCLFAFLESGKNRWLFLAGLCCGALGAIKYPQLYFTLLPMAAILLIRHRWMLWGALLLLVCSVAAGFLLLSPSEIVNPAYIMIAIQREGNVYVTGALAVTTPLANLLTTVAYHFLYSDIPFSPVWIVVACVFILRRQTGRRTPTVTFQGLVVPLVFLLFLIYNMFANIVVLRTLYIFFCVGILYASYGLYQILQRKATRVIALVLCLLMLGRSVILLSVFSEPSRENALQTILTQNDLWPTRKRTVMLGNIYLTGNAAIPAPVEAIPLDQLIRDGFPDVQPGDMVVTAPFEHYFAYSANLPVENESLARLTQNWLAFKEKNQAYYIGQPYPEWYYELFGYQLHISTGTLFEMPTNFVYGRASEKPLR